MSVETVETVEVQGLRVVGDPSHEVRESVRAWVETVRAWGFEIPAARERHRACAGSGVVDPALVGLHPHTVGSMGTTSGAWVARTVECTRCGVSVLPGRTRVSVTGGYSCVGCATVDEYGRRCGEPAPDAAWRKNTAPGKSSFQRDWTSALAHEGFTFEPIDGLTVDKMNKRGVKVAKSHEGAVSAFLATGVRPAPKRARGASGAPKAPKAPKVATVAAVEPTPAPVCEPAPTVDDSNPTRPLPAWADEWLAQLVHAPKREYARAYLVHRLTGGPAPVDPGADWAEKARKRADRLARVNA